MFDVESHRFLGDASNLRLGNRLIRKAQVNTVNIKTSETVYIFTYFKNAFPVRLKVKTCNHGFRHHH